MARTTGRLRGDALLLAHLGALERLTDGRAVSARERLEERLGRTEAGSLIRAMTAAFVSTRPSRADAPVS